MQTRTLRERAPDSAHAERLRLSVCCLAGRDGGRAAAAIEPLRAVADEVVVALDDRAGEAGARALAAVADLVVPYPYAEPVDRPLPWLVGRCSGDWILIVDDDEVPSAALVDALPRLVGAADVTHYWLPRRWLYPDAASWLDEPPWSPDFQVRLVTSDRRLLRFPDETHRPIEALGPCRYLDLPLYHADCLLKSPEERLAKARKYERLRPGKRVVGRPMNHVYHLPERHASPRLAPVPPEDAAFVERLLAARPVGTGRIGRVSPPAAREEIDRAWPGRALRDGDYRARLELLEPPLTMPAGERRAVTVRVTNLGGEVWPWGRDGHPEIRIGYHWLDSDGGMVVLNGLRSLFPADLRPGEAALVPVHVLAPAVPGRFRLELDLVHERVRWFECGTRADVVVRPSPRAAVAGDAGSVERALERLNEERPDLQPLVLARPPPLPPRFGPPQAPDLYGYLFDGAPAFRPLWAPVLVARTATLLRAALRHRRRRRSAPLPRGAEELLGALARCESLVLVGTVEADTWALWERTTLALTARTLRLRVEVDEGALPAAGGPVDAALASLLRRLVQ